MKTTVEIPNPLLTRAQALAREQGMTLAALVEEGLRRVVDEHSRQRRAFKLRDASVGGHGIRPELSGSFDGARAAIYEGRGG